MLIQFSNLFKKPVFCIETKSSIAKISNIVIDPENGKVLAFLVQNSILGHEKLICSEDIIDLKNEIVIIHEERVIIEIDEVVRIKNIIYEKKLPIGSWVQTKSGEWLGKVDDLLIESDTLGVLKYYIKGTNIGMQTKPLIGTMKDNIIIPQENILEIKSNLIIVKNNKIKGTEKVPATEMEIA